MAKKLELIDDQMCFGCGKKNSRGLQLDFELDKEKRRLKTRWRPVKEHQGYANLVHGGMIGLVLDEMMVNLLWALKNPAVSAQFSVRLRRPAIVGEPLDCEAWITEESGPIFRTEAEARNARGEVVALATAKCLVISEEDE